MVILLRPASSTAAQPEHGMDLFAMGPRRLSSGSPHRGMSVAVRRVRTSFPLTASHAPHIQRWENGMHLAVPLELVTMKQLKDMDPRGALWYGRALDLARRQDFEKARRVFAAIVVTYPNLCRAWVSWAQMEKKAVGWRFGDVQEKDYGSCRAVLQRGLSLNPRSSCICQAWGLMELQKGNALAAVRLLDRSATYDANCKPVQNWQLYKDARRMAAFHHKPTGPYQTN